MLQNCEVIVVFNTTLGILAGINFKDEIPYIGLTLQNNRSNVWKIKGLGMSKRELINDSYTSVWDCILEAVNHNDQIEKGDILLYVNR
jgi:hypothetical protein